MPFTIFDHTMIQYDNDFVYIIGGIQDYSISNKTWRINIKNNFLIEEGPPLNIPRAGHSCGKININGKVSIIVTGGTSNGSSYLDSVELLDPTSGQVWEYGPKLPFKVYGSVLINSPCGHGVILIGGDKGRRKYSNELLELNRETSINDVRRSLVNK